MSISPREEVLLRKFNLFSFWNKLIFNLVVSIVLQLAEKKYTKDCLTIAWFIVIII